jgi:hypothetical protein
MAGGTWQPQLGPHAGVPDAPVTPRRRYTQGAPAAWKTPVKAPPMRAWAKGEHVHATGTRTQLDTAGKARR